MSKSYKYDEVLQSTLEYFDGDELAANVWISKYALKDNDGNLYEKNPDDMHKRISKEFARIEINKFKNPLTEEEIYNLLKDFKYIVPQGSPMFGIGNNYQIISLSNCYLLNSPEDCYNSILDTDKQLVNISKRRGGVGIDLSKLRYKGSITRNAARTSTGIVSWMERYSNSIREVGQNARRGALMLTLDVHHPDIKDFCTIKNDPTKVTGANISVKLSKEFIDALNNDSDYELRFPIDYKQTGLTPNYSKFIKAKEIWDIIINSAWEKAEPGILAWFNTIQDGPSEYYDRFKSSGTNPCCLAESYEHTVWIKPRQDYLENLHKNNQYLSPAHVIQPINITEVLPSDLIWAGPDCGFKKCSGYFKCGKAQVYQVGYQYAGQIEYIYCTSNHKLEIFGTHKLIKLSQLKVGDKISINNGQPGYSFPQYGVEIVSIENVGEDNVGCVEVEDCHKFACNGIISGNSELNLSELDSCRLLLLNLLSYVVNPYTKKSYFNYELFYKHSKIAQRLMDNLVDLESEKIDKIIQKIKSDPEDIKIKQYEIDMWEQIKKNNDEGRRTGTGITALGDCLAALGIEYGSQKSVEITEEIYKTLKFGCYQSSVEMAEELGAFTDWNWEQEKKCPFLQRFDTEFIECYNWNTDVKIIYGCDIINKMKKVGRRNVALLTTAPAGSVSILTQTSSGIEPVFMLSYKRRKKINYNDTNIRIDFIDQNGDKWQEFEVFHPEVYNWKNITGKTDLSKSPWYNCCAENINWTNRVLLQAAAQKHVDHSISSTINLPEDVSKEEVSKIYLEAFKKGCKGITIYRKNCRTGVLVDKNTNQSKIILNNAPKRPIILPCEIFETKIEGKSFFVIVGLLNNMPYEVFAGKLTFNTKEKHGKLKRISRGKYCLLDNEDNIICENICHNFTNNQQVLTRLLSLSLRHGIPIEFIIHQIEKGDKELLSSVKIITRVLKKYIKDGTKVTGQTCEKCNGNNVVRENGCQICKDCGDGKCQ